MPESSLPKSAIDEDHRLEKKATTADVELAKHRWHWTLDESNPDRVTFYRYGKDVGVDDVRIAAAAKGYAAWRDAGSPDGTLNEFMERSKTGEDRQAATDAVANARGSTYSTTTRTRRDEVKKVHDIARERAEKRGTTVKEEAPSVAESIVKADAAAERVRSERKERLGARYIELEALIADLRRRFVRAINLAGSVEWGQEELELLTPDADHLEALAKLYKVALTGTDTDVDWDAELEKLTTT